MEHTIKIYTTPTCTYCKMTKEFLTEKGFSFEELDVTQNEEARNEMIQRSGQMGVPVIDIDGELIVGFDKDRISEKLNISG